jgi:alkylation response protein AidB-like acyl-CoA dehydrogenase
MNFSDTKEEAAFRLDVRSFIEDKLPREFYTPEYRERYQEEEAVLDTSDPPLARWQQAIADKGWIAPHWPREYGGAGMSFVEQFIFNEEMATAGAPFVGGLGVQLIGPTLIMYGTDEQKKQHLPGITSGKVWWCQGFSEPGAGSDLASLQTRAVRDGDEYVINGQKIWTSGAHLADWMFLLARTDSNAPKHKGISMLLLDMKSPGITVRPLISITGDHGFNEVFFEDVRTPVGNLIGEENRGWYIATTLLDFERSNIRGTVKISKTVDNLVAYVRERKDANDAGTAAHEAIRMELADRYVEGALAKMMSRRIVAIQQRGDVANYEASLNKLFFAHAEQRVYATGMKILGLYGGLYRDQKWAPLTSQVSQGYLASTAASVYGGSNEIQKNIIATRGLGLPRSS